jgi:nucleolar protein TMA23
MDSAALLKSQGWRGKGFSLHPTDNKIGLTNPLLLSRNTDGRGVGQKPHHTSDQWWLSAFDEKLKGLDTSQKGRVVQSVTTGKLDTVAASKQKGKYVGINGLYAVFVRGGFLDGTITPDSTEESTDATPTSQDFESAPRRIGETKEQRRERRAAKKLRKQERAARRVAKAESRRKRDEKATRRLAREGEKLAKIDGETKEERRARRAEGRARKEERRRRRIRTNPEQTAG